MKSLYSSSTPEEMITHSPYVLVVEDRMLDHQHKPVNPAGHWDQIGAMHRVALRRHIREFFPDFGLIVNIIQMDEDQLKAAIRRFNGE